MSLPLLVDIWTDEIIPLLASPADLLALGAVNRAFHRLICAGPEAELVWKRRIRRDLRFPIESTARQSGWLDLYFRIRRPRIYLWGEAKNNRLALGRGDRRIPLLSRQGGIPVPAQIKLDTPIVDLVAGGWSFHALSVEGRVYHWGQLDGMAFAPFRPSNSPDPLHAHPGSAVNSPTLFAPSLPPIQRILSGRDHVIALDEDGQMWTWANWAEAGCVQLPALSKGGALVRDMAAGWQFTAVLTECRKYKSQDVWVWWQKFLSPSLHGQNVASSSQKLEGVDACYSFSPQAIKLPELHTRPYGGSDSFETGETITKLAAGDHFVLALSTSGRVYKLDITPPRRGPPDAVADDEALDTDDDSDGRLTTRQVAELESMFASRHRLWEYLPLFSEQVGQEDRSGASLGINHISASYKTFFAIGQGVVLQGSSETTPASQPMIKPELQNRGVIRVECGDYHFGALTEAGELLTFGEYSNGALGHGLDNTRLTESLRTPNSSLSVPTKVEFIDPFGQRSDRNEYCFNIAMAGWASSALTVDLSQDAKLNDEKEADKPGQDSRPAESHESAAMSDSSSSAADSVQPTRTLGDMTNIIRGRGTFGRLPFRIGYAGRGMVRGRGRGGPAGGEEAAPQ